MAERNEQVLDRVRQELKKNPGLGSRALYDIAMGIDGSIAENSLQQFHARYVLPIKRERAAAQGGGRAKRGAAQKKGPRAESKPVSQAPKSETGPAASPSKPRRRRRRGGPDRDQVRSVFMQFARDFANAESRGEVVQILSDVDRYVNQVIEG